MRNALLRWLEARLRAPLVNHSLLTPPPPPADPPWAVNVIPLRQATRTKQTSHLRVVEKEQRE